MKFIQHAKVHSMSSTNYSYKAYMIFEKEHANT